jgi:hypothetical protein
MLDVTKQSRIQIQDLPQLIEVGKGHQKAIVRRFLCSGGADRDSTKSDASSRSSGSG